MHSQLHSVDTNKVCKYNLFHQTNSPDSRISEILTLFYVGYGSY